MVIGKFFLQRISCRYGILPSTICKTFEANQNIQDGGIADFYKPETRKFYKGLFLLEVTR